MSERASEPHEWSVSNEHEKCANPSLPPSTTRSMVEHSRRDASAEKVSQHVRQPAHDLLVGAAHGGNDHHAEAGHGLGAFVRSFVGNEEGSKKRSRDMEDVKVRFCISEKARRE